MCFFHRSVKKILVEAKRCMCNIWTFTFILSSSTVDKHACLRMIVTEYNTEKLGTKTWKLYPQEEHFLFKTITGITVGMSNPSLPYVCK